MRRTLLLITSLLILSGLKTYSQFFIPIIIPYSTQTYACKSKDDKAIEYIQKGFDNYDENVSVSIAYFREAIKVDSFFCDAYYGLVKAYTKIKDYDKAMEINELSLSKINAIQPWLMKQEGMLYMRKKAYQQASDYFNSMIELQPCQIIWHYYHAESLIKLNLYLLKCTKLQKEFLASFALRVHGTFKA